MTLLLLLLVGTKTRTETNQTHIENEDTSTSNETCDKKERLRNMEKRKSQDNSKSVKERARSSFHKDNENTKLTHNISRLIGPPHNQSYLSRNSEQYQFQQIRHFQLLQQHHFFLNPLTYYSASPEAIGSALYQKSHRASKSPSPHKTTDAAQTGVD